MGMFLCYPKCSTCRKAKKWLMDNKIDFEERLITENNPTFEELSSWILKSGLPVKKFFNTSGTLYKNLGLKDKLKTMDQEEQLRILSSDGMLVKRPVFVNESFILVGFKEEEWTVLKD